VLSKEAYDTLLAQAQQYQTLVDQLKAKEKLEESQRLEYSKDEFSETSIQGISRLQPSNINKVDASNKHDEEFAKQVKSNENDHSSLASDKESNSKQQ
jgi:hypothetical protein